VVATLWSARLVIGIGTEGLKGEVVRRGGGRGGVGGVVVEGWWKGGVDWRVRIPIRKEGGYIHTMYFF